MFHRRVLLVGTELAPGQAVQTHFHKTFLLQVPIMKPEATRMIVEEHNTGLLIFLLQQDEDYLHVQRLSREFKIQNYPVRMVSMSFDHRPHEKHLPMLRHMETHFTWPLDVKELNAWIRTAVRPGDPFGEYQPYSLFHRMKELGCLATPSLKSLMPRIEAAITHDVPVLIEGEAGTGKVQLARLIHQASCRGKNKFLPLACTPENKGDLPRVLFGDPRATQPWDKQGKLEMVECGTLLLEHVEHLSAEMQHALLRLIEGEEYETFGTVETKISRARLMVTAQCSLADEVRQERFSRDLFYRLDVVSIRLPPLRERPQDIAPLVRYFLAEFGSKFGKQLDLIDPEVLKMLELASWPGNVRQLSQVLQQAVINSTHQELKLEHFHGHLAGLSPSHGSGKPPQSLGSLAHHRETTERASIIQALEKVGFSRTRAAQILGVSRVTLYKKMKKYGLLSPSNDESEVPLSPISARDR